MREAVRGGKSKNGALKMSKATLIATLMAAVSAFSFPAKAQVPLKTKPSAKSDQPTYMITAHTVDSTINNYVIVYGSEVLTVFYAESQISTVKPGASLLEVLPNLHWHIYYGSGPQEPDVSQVPHIGVPIRACEMDTKHSDINGHPSIAIQSVSTPCMSRDGNRLHYVVAPNGGVKKYEFVNFIILEATNNAGVAATQSAQNAPANVPPTIDQQLACRAQANTVLQQERTQWASPGEYLIAFSGVTSRFDASTGTCYARTDFVISVKNKNGPDGVILTTGIQDAFGGTSYASDIWDNSQGKQASEISGPILCSVKLRGHAEITCKTTDEFMALVDKDFGL